MIEQEEENREDAIPSLDQPETVISYAKLVSFLETEIAAGREAVNASELLQKIRNGDFAG